MNVTCLILASMLSGAQAAVAQIVPLSDPLPGLAVLPDGPVSHCAFGGDALFVAGSFDTIGVHTGSFALIDPDTGTAVRQLPVTNGDVRTVAPDGEGGWYVGGDFTLVDDLPRKNLAHVNARGELTAFAPQVAGEVFDLAVDSEYVYVAGAFSSVSGQPRNNIASINRQTGNPTLFDPDASSSVVSIEVVGTTVYAAGAFNTIGGTPRAGLAAMENFLGDVLPFDPVTSGSLSDMTIEAGTMYVAGLFSYDQSPATRHVVSIDLGSGAPDGVVDVPYSFGLYGTVNVLAAGSDALYVGGKFDTLGASARMHVGAIDRNAGTVIIWAPSISQPDYFVNPPEIFAIAVDEDTVFVGGDFHVANGEERIGLAAFGSSPQAPLLASFHPTLGGGNGPLAWALAIDDGALGVGGRFQIVGDPAPSVAKYDIDTGERIPWIEHWPVRGVRGVVGLSLVPHEGLLYIGGVADMIDGPNQGFLVALDEVTGEVVLDLSNKSDQRQLGHFPSGNQVLAFAGKTLVAVLASEDVLIGFDTTTGQVLWEQPFEGSINALQIGPEPTTVIVAGSIEAIGEAKAAQAQALGMLTAASGEAVFWDLPVNDDVLAFDRIDDRVYLAGEFTSLGGLIRERLAAVDLGDLSAPTVTSWEPDPDANVSTVAAIGDTIVVGGNFNTVGGSVRPKLAALDPQYGYACEWKPEPSEAPVSLAHDGQVIALAVSAQATFAGSPRPHIGAFETGVCYADFNGDCTLNILDFVAYSNAFVGDDPTADCNGDGQMNILDFVCFQVKFQSGCP